MRPSSITAVHGIALALCPLLACAGGPPAPRGAAPVTVAAGPLPSGPADPVRGLPMPSLDVPWTPPMLTAGDLEQLRDALAGHDAIALHLGERFAAPEPAAQVQHLVEALRPGASTEVLDRDDAPFEGVALPLEREPDDGPARPRYRAPEALRPVETEASAVLVLDDAALPSGPWRALSARAVGSCHAPMAALAAGQEQALAELEPFLDHADAVLWQVYRPALQAALPRLLAELEPYRPSDGPSDGPSNGASGGTAPDDEHGWQQHQCGRAYWQYLQAFARCGDEAAPCPAAPRVFLVGGARIGTAEPSVYVPEGCAATLGRDYVVELRSIAAEAAQVAREHLAPSWTALADRLGAVTEVYDALDDVCTPRRRRFASDDLAAARQRLAAIGRALASDELAHPDGGWVLADDVFHVPGYGPVRQVATYDAGPGSASEAVVSQARALRELLLRRALCRGSQAPPLAAAVVDPRSGRVHAFGYFFEEELSCGELPPLWAEPRAVAP